MAVARGIGAREGSAVSGKRVGDRLTQLRHRAPAKLRDQLYQVWLNLGLIAQSGLAAAIAWVLATRLLEHPEPVFAPIAAVSTLAASAGQRLRNTIELVLGVALGIGVGDLVILGIGAGWWQLGLVVTLAIAAAIFVGGSPSLVIQAAIAAVLIATLAPPDQEGIYADRFFDALVGGVVALAVITVLLPLRPLNIARRSADPAIDLLGTAFREAGESLAARDEPRANAALDRLRGAEDDLSAMQDAIQAGRETATLAPVRWQARGALTQYVNAAEYIMRSVRNGRVLARRCTIAIEENEHIPEALPRAIGTLADGVTVLRRELAEGTEPREARGRLLCAATEVGEAYAAGVGFSGSVVVAQLRAIAIDLVQATGVAAPDADRLVRHAVGARAPNQPG